MNRRRLRALAPLLALSLALTACSTPTNYFEARGHDIPDMIDVKWACDVLSFGIGAKLEATNYLNAGVGYGSYDDIYESFGRYATRGAGEFLHLGIYGYDGSGSNNVPGANAEYNIAFVNCCQEDRPPIVDRFRFGGEVLVLGLNAGLYLNTGEVLDFILGIAGIDIAGDDELAWNSEW